MAWIDNVMESGPEFRYPSFTNGEVSDSIIDDVFIDLDGVTADFEHNMKLAGLEADEFKLKPGSYVWLPPIRNAVKSINLLFKAFPDRVWFLTKPPKFSPYAYVEKALWVQHHFGDEGLHHLIVTQHKGLVGTQKSILIDDRPHKGSVDKFRGRVIHFDSLPSPESVAEFGIDPKNVVDWIQTLAIINTLISQRTHAVTVDR